MTPFSVHKALGDVARLFFPPVCPVCEKLMGEGSALICTHCRGEIPLTNFCRTIKNPMTERCAEVKLPVVNASAFMYYVRESDFKNLIHTIKYRGGWKLGISMGEWYGEELSRSGLYSDVDVVVPVPLHWFKQLRRGYNQSQYIAEGIARALERQVCSRNLVRRIHQRSQTLVGRENRWKNVAGVFAVRNPEALRGKHILLVDDVMTTGATLYHCAAELRRSIPGCSVSIAALAVSHNELHSADPTLPWKKADASPEKQKRKWLWSISKPRG